MIQYFIFFAMLILNIAFAIKGIREDYSEWIIGLNLTAAIVVTLRLKKIFDDETV